MSEDKPATNKQEDEHSPAGAAPVQDNRETQPQDELLDKPRREIYEAAHEFVRRVEEALERQVAGGGKELDTPELDQAVAAVKNFIGSREVKRPR